jgi:ergothioneine biosynthesis protein EgtB
VVYEHHLDGQLNCNSMKSTKDLRSKYRAVRQHSVHICAPLETEDYVVQPVADVSPPKWHLGHTTWFFETFVLQPHFPGYQVFNPSYNFVFNSYYESVGARVVRTDRGNLSRPSVADVYAYRVYVDEQMTAFFDSGCMSAAVFTVLELGLNHEQQHQELLYTDIKYILGHNPLFPAYGLAPEEAQQLLAPPHFIAMEAGMYEIGFNGDGFCFDNELGHHRVYLGEYEIASALVSNAEYLEFIAVGGYQDFRYWHAEGWDWVQRHKIAAPLYWHKMEGDWMYYTLGGLSAIVPNAPVCHVSYYEAAAFAAWKGCRLPTEAEWEAAAARFDWGQRWEWTGSAYLPYPGYKKETGAIGEYNGKFMVNQLVLRGASWATPEGHSRDTYRNFFHPQHQWQYTGIRLVR